MSIDIKTHWPEAVHCFNQHQFFECHEVLEAIWLSLSPGSTRQFIQGLLQVAVGFYHWQRGNWVGAKNKLASGIEKLQVAGEQPEWLDPTALSVFLQNTDALLQMLLTEGPSSVEQFPADKIPTLTLLA